MGNPVSATNKIECHDITEILLKVALNTITPTPSLALFILRRLKKFAITNDACIFFIVILIYMYVLMIDC